MRTEAGCLPGGSRRRILTDEHSFGMFDSNREGGLHVPAERTDRPSRPIRLDPRSRCVSGLGSASRDPPPRHRRLLRLDRAAPRPAPARGARHRRRGSDRLLLVRGAAARVQGGDDAVRSATDLPATPSSWTATRRSTAASPSGSSRSPDVTRRRWRPSSMRPTSTYRDGAGPWFLRARRGDVCGRRSARRRAWPSRSGSGRTG